MVERLLKFFQSRPFRNQRLHFHTKRISGPLVLGPLRRRRGNVSSLLMVITSLQALRVISPERPSSDIGGFLQNQHHHSPSSRAIELQRKKNTHLLGTRPGKFGFID